MDAFRLSAIDFLLKPFSSAEIIRSVDLVSKQIRSKEILISKGLKEYEDILAPFQFIRVHHSHLINLRQVVRFDKADRGALIIANKDHVPVSQRKREVLLEALNQI